MSKYCLKALFLLFFITISTVLIGCATQKYQITPTAFKPYEFQAGQYDKKVDNFLVILDASSSMSDSYNKQPKLTLAKDVVSRMNQTIPPDLELNGALRTFGACICPFGPRTALIYGLTAYTKAGFEEALLPVTPGGNSPLACAINASAEDLKSTQGDIALIVVSDGRDMDDTPVVAAESIKSQFGERICIYSVLVGDDPGGEKLMGQIAQIGECGYSIAADCIMSSKDMADFVERVFLVKAGRPGDSDGDGVPDNLDQCPNTPRGVKVDARGCPLDTDGDGVYDYLDKCPGTPTGVSVDESGCPLDTDGDGVYDYLDECPGTPKGATVNMKGCWVIKGVLFDTAKWDIKPQAYSALDEIAVILGKNPSLKLEVQGHTDNIGSMKYNKVLSENRAKAVMEYLVEKGVAPDRLCANGFWFSRPVSSNDTPEGRARNRRVELKPMR